MDEIREIALRIKELREICEYSEEEVAARVGVDVETYREYERTGKDIPINTIYQLSKMYKVDMSEILTGVHDLPMARLEARRYLEEVLENIQPENLNYPE